MPKDLILGGCLARIRKCDFAAAGVLADHLDEIRHPLARSFRRMYGRYEDRVTYWLNANPDRLRKHNRGEYVRRWNVWLWLRVQKLFKRKWRWPGHRAFRPIIPIVVPQEGDSDE